MRRGRTHHGPALPTTLADVGLEGADLDVLKTVADAATSPQETIHNMPFAVSSRMVLDAMVAADAYSRAHEQSVSTSAAAA